MEGKRLLRSITLKNILSFGPEGQTLDFEPLNVLIGANGSGKSNILAVMGLLQSLPNDMQAHLRESGVGEWIWKGFQDSAEARIESIWTEAGEVPSLRHLIAFKKSENRAHVREELVESVPSEGSRIHYQKRHHEAGAAGHNPIAYDFFKGENVKLNGGQRPRDQSVLKILRDENRYPGLEKLNQNYDGIKIYRDWAFGPSAPIRNLKRWDQATDDFLSEDCQNLVVILRKLQRDDSTRQQIQTQFKQIYEGASEIICREIGESFLQLVVKENPGGFEIPATRLSDGTLRFLCLLAILCNPIPPPLTCLEEPELGLHPDIISTIARLLIDASQRTQLIVTTHSAELISALGDFPEAVVVCERGFDGETTLNRLDPKRLEEWLEDYTLGHLWESGEIGGNRW